MAMERQGVPADEVLDQLEGLRVDDLRWKDGRAFSLAYHAGDEVHALATAAYARYSSENMLNLDAFPGVRRMQQEVTSEVCRLLGAGDDAVGVFTSGGTESILTVVEGARNRGRDRGITEPELVLPTSAHAAFTKACHYFGVKSVRVPVRDDFRADPEAMAAAINERTVMVVCSAPSYPQGVIDPVAEIAPLAAERDILCHVDACMGFTLPWLTRLGLVDVPWGFEVPGVTSMSCDLHKYGYTAKGASVLAHRTRDLRRHHVFVTTDWLGGLYGSPALLGTRSAGPLASAWAVMRFLGEEGYLRLSRDACEARRAIEQHVRSIEGLVVRGKPDTTLLSFGAVPTADGSASLDVFAVADALWRDGRWYVDRQTPPDSLHLTVNAVHATGTVLPDFLAALDGAITEVRAGSAEGDRTRAYGTVD